MDPPLEIGSLRIVRFAIKEVFFINFMGTGLIIVFMTGMWRCWITPKR
jgi:hypothetical protein